MPFPWPPELLERRKLEEAIAWIRDQAVDREIVRKYMIIEWCKLTAYQLTADLVDRVYVE